MQDDSCDIIDISSNGKSFDHINKNLLFHDWLGKYYNIDWQNSVHEKKSEYRKIGKIRDRESMESRKNTYYHIGLSYAETLGYWGV